MIEVCWYIKDIGIYKISIKGHCAKDNKGHCQICSKVIKKIRWKILGIIVGLGLFFISLGI